MGPLVSDFRLIVCSLRTVHFSWFFMVVLCYSSFEPTRLQKLLKLGSKRKKDRDGPTKKHSNGLTKKALKWPHEKSIEMAPRKKH
jgi:hypothetical protein